MSARIRGLDATVGRMKKAIREIGAAAETGVNVFAEGVLTEARDRAPKKTGDLRRSGIVSVESSGAKIVARVAFTVPYAARQHEDTTLNHTDGEAKYLERALDNQAPNLESVVGRYAARAAK